MAGLNEADNETPLSIDQVVLIEEGRKKSRITGVIFIVLCAFDGLGDVVSLFNMISPAYYLVQIILDVLAIAAAVRFIKGSNTARVILGAVYYAAFVIILLGAVLSLFAFAYSILALPVVVFLAVFVKLTLFDKGVKAYCKQSEI